MQNHDAWLRAINPDEGNYIAGFVDGEGSFNISLRKRSDHTLGWQVAPSFNISQKDRVILAWIKKVFGCGTLRSRKDGVVYFEIRNTSMLYERVLPFFKRFGFRSAAEKRNFNVFAQIIKLLHKNQLNKQIFDEVVQLREKLNVGHGRKRKNTIQNIK